jgi:perosamine synthetase
MLTTNDDALADRLRFLKDHGMSKDRRYFHSELAFNYRLTNIQAALGCAQLDQIEEFIAKKRQILGWYREGLAEVKGLQLNVEREGYRNIFWMVSGLVAEESPLTRDELCVRLKTFGIDTRPFFVSMSELPHLANLRQISADGSQNSIASSLSRRGFSLPSGCDLTKGQVQRAVEAVRKLLSAS